MYIVHLYIRVMKQNLKFNLKIKVYKNSGKLFAAIVLRKSILCHDAVNERWKTCFQSTSGDSNTLE
jgi:hypothetical protein